MGDLFRQLAHFIIENQVYLTKTSFEGKWIYMSYGEMANHLIYEKTPGTSVDLIIVTASVMLDIPILMVWLTQHKVLETGHVYYKFHEIHTTKTDEHLATSKHNFPCVQWD